MADNTLVNEARDAADECWQQAHPPGLMLPDYQVAMHECRARLFARLAERIERLTADQEASNAG